MEGQSSRHAKVRREVFIASIRSAAFYPAGVVVLEVLLASVGGWTNRVVALIVATLLALVAYFLTLVLWARRRAHRIENFVEKLEPRLRDAAVTKHEGLVLVLDNGLLLRVENKFDIAVADPLLGAWVLAQQSGSVKEPVIANFVRWHRQYHGLRVLRPIGSFGAGGIDQERFDAVRLRLQSQYVQVALFERDLGRRGAPEGLLREAACFIEQPRWWAIGDLVSTEVDELAALLRGLVRSETDPALVWPPEPRKSRG
jgi:hypothetical protein